MADRGEPIKEELKQEERPRQRSGSRGRDRKRERGSRSKSRERRRRRKGSRERGRRRKRRRRSRSESRDLSPDDGEPRTKGLKPRRRGERRHKNLWDMTPVQAEELGLLTGLPIQIGAKGDFMHADRSGRRVYVGNLPINVNENELRDFFNATMVAAQGPNRKPGSSVLGVFLNIRGRFAFIEFRSATEATQAMDLDGIMFRGLSLKMGRPTNFNPTASQRNIKKLDISHLGIKSNHVPDGPNKLYIGGIPYTLKEDQVRQLLETYGPLRGLFLSYDTATGMSKGYAFCYYEDESITDTAISGLNGLQIGNRTLSVKRHENSQKMRQQDKIANTNFQLTLKEMANFKPAVATKSLCMLNMVTVEELIDPNEVEEIRGDIKTECEEHGQVLNVIIPVPEQGKKLPGVGKIYVNFQEIDQAKKCKDALSGRTFGGRTVVVSFMDDEKFDRRDFR